jgi:hypothetical protein
LVSLPDAHDHRYPRRWWYRLLRQVATLWWVPLALYVSYGSATLLLLSVRTDIAWFITPNTIAAAFGAAPALSFVAWAPWLLSALLVVVLGGALVVAVRGLRWAWTDETREAMVLLLREVRTTEQANTLWMRNALAPALEWRLHALRRRHVGVVVALLLAALVAGALMALFSAGPDVSLFVLPHP